MTNSILDIEPTPGQTGRRIRDLTERIEYLEARNGLLEDMVLSSLSIAVCDFCHARWFHHHGPLSGDADGLLAGEGACCTGCLDALYEKTVDMDDEADPIFIAVARWLEKYPQNINLSRFRDH